MRSVGLDVHRISVRSRSSRTAELRSAGRVETTPERLELFAASLAPDDRVALEVTGNAWEIARILEPHVARVVVVSPSDTTIRQARAKTDRLDARTLARLLAAGSLDGVWMPDEATWMMRRRLSRRSQLVWARSRAKNQVHAVLMRQLVGRPPFSDVFGIKPAATGSPSSSWRSRSARPSTARSVRSRSSTARSRGRAADRPGSARSPEIKRLMSVPGVNVIVAATFLAAVGDIRRFKNPRKLVGYLGLDPKVRQSGAGPATHGHISKQGSTRARHALVEACWTTVRQPGPLHAFYQRVRGRRGHSVAIVAAARKLACLFWCLLTRDEDYAYQQPSLTKKKLRRLEITAGAPKYPGPAGSGLPTTRCAKPSSSSPAKPRSPTSNTVRDYHAAQAGKTRKVGASATPGHASKKPEGQSCAADHKPLTSALRSSVTRAHPTRSHTPRTNRNPT